MFSLKLLVLLQGSHIFSIDKTQYMRQEYTKSMKKYVPWLAAVVLVTILFGAMYTLVQQTLRLGANDPQIQMAEDAAAQLNGGARPAPLIGGRVDIGKSLAPFILIYDKSGNVAAGSGYLNGAIPALPRGVLTHAKGSSYNAVTWQPKDNVRIASVTVAADNYYVLSGRSLRETESRANGLAKLVGASWFVSLLVLAAAWRLTQRTASRGR